MKFPIATIQSIAEEDNRFSLLTINHQSKKLHTVIFIVGREDIGVEKIGSIRDVPQRDIVKMSKQLQSKYMQDRGGYTSKHVIEAQSLPSEKRLPANQLFKMVVDSTKKRFLSKQDISCPNWIIMPSISHGNPMIIGADYNRNEYQRDAMSIILTEIGHMHRYTSWCYSSHVHHSKVPRVIVASQELNGLGRMWSADAIVDGEIYSLGNENVIEIKQGVDKFKGRFNLPFKWDGCENYRPIIITETSLH